MRKTSRKAILLGAAVGALGSFLPSFSAQAGTFTWSAGSGNWSTNGNWLPNSGNPNSSSDIAIFGATGTLSTVNTSRAVGSIIFNIDANFTVNGSSTLTLNTGISAASPGATGRTYTISAPISLSNNVTLNAANNSTLTISNVINDSSTFGLTKNNSGLLILSNANTYHGSTTINAGTLQLSGGSNRLPTTTAVSMAGGTLDLNDNSQTIGSLSGSAGTVDLGSAILTLGDSSNTTFSGVITGTGNVVKQGSGVSTFGGANTYTGVTTISSGVLAVTSVANGGTNSGVGASSNAAANLLLDGGTLRYTGAGASTDRLFTFSETAGLDASGSGAVTFTNTGALGIGGDKHNSHTLTLTGTGTGNNSLAGLITDPSLNTTSVVKSGSGKWILANASNSYAGSTTITGGTLEIATIGNGGSTSPIGSSSTAATSLILDGGALRYTGGNGATDRLYSVGTNGGIIDASGTSGSLNFNGSGSIGFNSENGSRTLALTGSNTGSNTMSVIIRDQGTGSLTSLTKDGAGRWLVNSANTYTGATTISGGTLEASVLANGGTNSSIGKSTNAAGNLVLNGGILRYTGSGASIDRNYTLGANGGGIDASGSAGTLAISGNLTASAVGGSQTFTLAGSNVNPNTLSGQIVNGMGGNLTNLYKDGAGKWVLSNTTNSYNGDTTVNNGTLALTASSSNSIASSPHITLTNSTSALDVTSLNSGAGLTLSTTVDQTLRGNGTIYGGVTASGAHNTTIAPGNSPGKLTFTGSGNISLTSTTTYEAQIGAPTTPGTTYDQIVISSTPAKTLNLGGAILKLLPSAGIVTGQAYTIVATSGAGASINFSSVFKNLDNTPMADNGTYTQGPMTFSIDYDSTFVKVTFTTVPEPTSLGLVLLGTPALLGRRRREHRR